MNSAASAQKVADRSRGGTLVASPGIVGAEIALNGREPNQVLQRKARVGKR